MFQQLYICIIWYFSYLKGCKANIFSDILSYLFYDVFTIFHNYLLTMFNILLEKIWTIFTRFISLIFLSQLTNFSKVEFKLQTCVSCSLFSYVFLCKVVVVTYLREDQSIMFQSVTRAYNLFPSHKKVLTVQSHRMNLYTLPYIIKKEENILWWYFTNLEELYIICTSIHINIFLKKDTSYMYI